MLSSRLSEYNRVWSCPAYRALILTEAPDTGADGERERKRDGWRKRAKEGGKSKAWKDWIEGGIGEIVIGRNKWLNAYLTEFVKINISFVFDSLCRRLYFNFWKRCIQFKYDSMAHHPNRVQSLHCVSLA